MIQFTPCPPKLQAPPPILPKKLCGVPSSAGVQKPGCSERADQPGFPGLLRYYSTALDGRMTGIPPAASTVIMTARSISAGSM